MQTLPDIITSLRADYTALASYIVSNYSEGSPEWQYLEDQYKILTAVTYNLRCYEHGKVQLKK